LCADALLSRPAVIVSGGSPAAERAWLMSASTCAAGVPGAAPAGSVADTVGAGVAGLDDTGLDDLRPDDAGFDDADAVGAGRPADRFLRVAVGAGGTLATAARKGRAAQDPPADEPNAEPPAAELPPADELPDTEPHVAGVCRAVTFPGAAGAPAHGALAR
jgi:hypothetical protein